ncbi:hypothetical protein [Reichenbachiella sp. MALMAid0571]|uniref:hypothetical protein n=1 Tax=Reichenbachiella sp. MALMAid0571 TaxID=3143939 RepID=UPI0032DED336
MSKKPDISKLNKKAPYSVPNDYFEKLPDIIQSRIALEEDEENVVVFDSVKTSKKLPFEVPERYFEQLPSVIQNKTQKSKKSRVISFGFEQQQIKWVLIPAAIAVFVLGYSLFFNQKTETVNTEELIAQVSSEDLIAYLEMSDLSTDEIISTVNFEEIDLEFENTESDMLDELNFSDEEIDDLLIEFSLETDV